MKIIVIMIMIIIRLIMIRLMSLPISDLILSIRCSFDKYKCLDSLDFPSFISNEKDVEYRRKGIH